jgi:hypothetical protein
MIRLANRNHFAVRCSCLRAHSAFGAAADIRLLTGERFGQGFR